LLFSKFKTIFEYQLIIKTLRIMQTVSITSQEFLNNKVNTDNEYLIDNKISCFFLDSEWNVTVLYDVTATYPESSKAYFRKTKKAVISLLKNSR